ncbi:sigma-54-dependent Fis family transcriptional regulator [Bacillus tuaregi]|uniref:sigma-54-dependent Fis family transcriptional regulator n=1 Tax=Bacillus tuaregi TaxID=1816695 RepID=UPI0008F8328E|nr:sigma 54-interacting transcriptional regulator [Bacillus tuaregi]
MIVETNILDQSMIKELWNSFMISGKIECADIRQEIIDSWTRCRKAGVDYLDGTCQSMISKADWQQLKEENQLLIDISIPIMKTLYKSFQDSPFCVVITNEAGIILSTVGDRDVLSKSTDLHFSAGADWSEYSVGTNAIGTALYLNEPIRVSGAEHYCRKHHEWTCLAAPIHHSQGRMIGCLNISGFVQFEEAHFRGMVLAAVRAIENQLQKDETKEELITAHKQLTTVISTISEGILSIDHDYVITHANASLANILGMLPSEMIGRKVTEIFGEDNPINQILEWDSASLEEEIILEPSNKEIRCTIKAIPIKNECLQIVGMVITVREIKQVHQIVNKMVGAQARFQFSDILGSSNQIKQIIKKAKIAGKSISTVLLLGESGTGKEVFAQAIHNASNRRNGPFIAVNCAAIPRDLIQSELFGYCDGAFTGAKRGGRPGKFELADGGTLFLDEIGDMSIDLQVNLLRVLQEKNVVRVGGDKPTSINVRVIAATNKSLKALVENGRFREDLYYRLNVITLIIPPLRERLGDIDIFLDYFLRKMSISLGKEMVTVEPIVKEIFNQYSWPGNIRELENVLEYGINMGEGEILLREYLPSYLLNQLNPTNGKDIEPVRSLATVEREAIERAVKKFAGNISKAAKALGIGRNTLYEKMKKYHIKH